MQIRYPLRPIYKRLLGTAVFLLCGMATVQAQKELPSNLPRFDKRPYHFGFILAYNSADFYMNLRPVFPTTDSLLSVNVVRQPGFNLGPLASLNFNKNFSLRFIPDISFQDRRLEYTFQRGNGKKETLIRRVESTFINLPLNLKMRTDRVNNFAAYALVGYQYSIDMASQKDVDNTGTGAVVKIKRLDQALQVGGGVDFFLPYFKFGIELKLSRGLHNVLIQDNTMFSSPIDQLRTRVFILSFTFEG